jgi:hypothetical protein
MCHNYWEGEMGSAIRGAECSELLQEIKQRVRAAQYEALKAVNKELIGLYWDIGRMIVDRQRGSSWGRSVVDQLAKDLQAEFPGIRGFSARNIWYMRSFYLHYRKNEKLQPLVAHTLYKSAHFAKRITRKLPLIVEKNSHEQIH